MFGRKKKEEKTKSSKCCKGSMEAGSECKSVKSAQSAKSAKNYKGSMEAGSECKGSKSSTAKARK